MKSNNFPLFGIKEELVDELSNILTEMDCTDIVVHKESSGVWLYSENNDVTELRVLATEKVIKVSRVQLVHKRCGIFTQIMQAICDYAKDNDIPDVVIEGVSTRAMYNWCEKNDYDPIKTTIFESMPSGEEDAEVLSPLIGDFRKHRSRKYTTRKMQF